MQLLMRGELMSNVFKIYGCRGSMPMAEPDFMKYGGNTSSYVIHTENNNLFFLDAGSGIRKAAAKELDGKENNIWLVLSHAHEDHIQGLGVSKLPFNGKKTRLIISNEGYLGLRQLYNAKKGYNFPVDLEKSMLGIDTELISQIRVSEFHTTAENKVKLDDVVIQAMMSNHPTIGYAGSVIYRFEFQTGNTLVYATDTEFDYIMNQDTMQANPFNIRERFKGNYVDFIKNASVLVADAQYTQEEYDNPNFNKHGWGHSYIEQIID
jgi:ribonuclease BN (tRNA processing enzyme)